MELKPEDVKLNILVVREMGTSFDTPLSEGFERLNASLQQSQLVEHVWTEERPYYYQSELESTIDHYFEYFLEANINTIFIDPFPSPTGYGTIDSKLEAITEFIFAVRKKSPGVVFVFYIDFDELENQKENFYAGKRKNFTHYFRLNRKLVGQEFDAALDNSLRACRDYVLGYKRKTLYEYDVALSFAGEDRPLAAQLAQCLRRYGVRVFYDSYEQAELWGKDLYTSLHAIYSKKAQYCVIFISSSYLTKMWTIHERKAAQERALQEREIEYILPIKIDETELPGLQSTIAYLSGSIGIQSICKILRTKLGKK
jgi:hypothetical protein